MYNLKLVAGSRTIKTELITGIFSAVLMAGFFAFIAIGVSAYIELHNPDCMLCSYRWPIGVAILLGAWVGFKNNQRYHRKRNKR
ncbi:hypothetical protein MACH26_13990 [Planctobacterium marinum]|uniref:Uncharacterized protein n=1 Tax=Planctobacterium marinum TaxID=1631968 RepID=A0AA48HU33_9ALTE|nr:hypothetical protein MACH26_13990 [Planctobacterium marinum]